jgi:DNA-binding transcriptional LysR family regulator
MKSKHSVPITTTVDLNAVAVFVRVVETGSFTRAAHELELPKSVVSRRVARLEQELGVRLLQRTTRKLTLTDAGARYHRQAAAALSALSEATQTVSSEQNVPRGLVRLTAPTDLLPGYFAEQIAEFCKRYPLVHVELDLTSRRVDLIAEGFDFALRAGVLQDSSLIARKITSSELIPVASPAYLEERGVPRRVSDLETHPFVLFSPNNQVSRLSLTGPKGVEHVELTGPVTVNSPSFARDLALAGLAMALVPSQACAEALAQGRLLRVLPDHSLPGAALYLVYPAARHVPQRVILLREFLFERLRAVFAAPN